MRTYFRLFSALATAAVLVAACDRDPTGTERTTAKANTGAPGDTSGTNPPPPPPPPPPGSDTSTTHPDTGSTYSGPVELTISVFAYVRVAPPSGADTLQLRVVADALVEAMPITSSGIGPAQTIGRTNAQGVIIAPALPSGPYRLRATPPAGSGLQAGESSVLANRAAMHANVTVYSTGG